MHRSAAVLHLFFSKFNQRNSQVMFRNKTKPNNKIRKFVLNSFERQGKSGGKGRQCLIGII